MASYEQLAERRLRRHSAHQRDYKRFVQQAEALTRQHLALPLRKIIFHKAAGHRARYVLMECGHWTSIPTAKIARYVPKTWHCWRCHEHVAPRARDVIETRLRMAEKYLDNAVEIVETHFRPHERPKSSPRLTR